MPIPRVLWSCVAIVSTVIAFSSIVDDTSQRYADEAFSNALVTFTIARTLNGVISVAQGTELALEPGGVGVILTLGQILDPINDLIERFSGVMLVATSSIGLQSVLLRISAWYGLTLALATVSFFALLALWWPGPKAARAKTIALRILLVAIFMRFAVPALVIGTTVIFDQFLAEDQIAATAALETTRDEIEAINEKTGSPEIENKSVFEQLGSMLDESLDAINPNAQLERLSERVSNSAEHIIDLIVIFILQTILLPVGFLWFVIRLIKSVGERVTRL